MTTHSRRGVARQGTGNRHLWLALTVILAGALAATPQGTDAQQTASLTGLDRRVSHALRERIGLVADSAVAAGLPVGPLIDKTLEGASKHADDQRILVAVHAMLVDLRVARRALGASASEEELTAGVAALRAGVSPAALTGLRRSLPRRMLTVPLSVLAALVTDGAPTALATTAVINNASRAGDSDLLEFGRTVAHALAGGVPAQTALTTPSLPAGTETGLQNTGRPPSQAPAKPPKP